MNFVDVEHYDVIHYNDLLLYLRFFEMEIIVRAEPFNSIAI